MKQEKQKVPLLTAEQTRMRIAKELENLNNPTSYVAKILKMINTTTSSHMFIDINDIEIARNTDLQEIILSKLRELDYGCEIIKDYEYSYFLVIWNPEELLNGDFSKDWPSQKETKIKMAKTLLRDYPCLKETNKLKNYLSILLKETEEKTEPLKNISLFKTCLNFFK